MADETTDISGIEQFSLCARYVDEADGQPILREDFLQFVAVTDVTGNGLAKTIKNVCSQLNLDLCNLRGQGYDGARAMSGKFQGCAAIIAAEHPQALYVHCASHAFNSAVGDACEIAIVKHTIGNINEIINFFRGSAQRQQFLNDVVDELQCEIKKTRLKKYCETRWLERLDAITTFKEFFCPIFVALDHIQERGNAESAHKAFILQQALKKCTSSSR